MKENMSEVFSVTKSFIFQQVQTFKLMSVSQTIVHSFMGLLKIASFNIAAITLKTQLQRLSLTPKPVESPCSD